MSKVTAPVMRYFGGKFRLADWIIEQMPPHRCYVEPFGGAASVLMKKPRSYAEIYNDLDSDIVNVFRVLRDPELCRELERRCILTPFARSEFEISYEPDRDPVEQARRTLFRAQAAFGSSGTARSRTGFRSDSKRDYQLSSHVWDRYPRHIASFCERLSGVIIESRPAIQLMEQHDGDDVLFYVDPPYIHSTRVMRNARYQHEMTEEDHISLLECLNQLQGMVVLSGYPSGIYQDYLNGWELRTKDARASGHRGTVHRTEAVWLNPRAQQGQKQMQMFNEVLA